MSSCQHLELIRIIFYSRVENIDSEGSNQQYSYEFSPCDPLTQCSNESAAVSSHPLASRLHDTINFSD